MDLQVDCPAEGLTVSYTIACHTSDSGVCLLLGMEPEAVDTAAAHIVLCSEAGGIGAAAACSLSLPSAFVLDL